MTAWLNANRKDAHYFWSLLGVLPFLVSPFNLGAAPVSWAMWPGFAKGIEVTLLDAVALSILLARFPARNPLPFKGVFLAYIAAVVIVIPLSDVPMSSSFYPWQLLRVFLCFAAVARVCAEPGGPEAIIRGLAIGVSYHAALSILDRLGGTVQAKGGMGHQNLLGMMTHMVLLPCFAWVMATGRSGWAKIGVAAAAIAVTLTASRATIGFAAVGFATLFVLAGSFRWNGRKAKIGIAAALGLAIAGPIAAQSFGMRFGSGPVITEDGERQAFERAADMIIADHPFGVGSNQYVVVANTKGYSDRAGVIWNFGSRAAHVHNVYKVVHAETGFLGLATFLLLFATVIISAIRLAWRFRRHPLGVLVLGCGTALATVALHGLYEWIFVTADTQYLFGTMVGMIAGASVQLRRDAAMRRGRLRERMRTAEAELPVADGTPAAA
jgi:O-antigen ligase